jgi:tetratricopeptide (TPR) repeat protein
MDKMSLETYYFVSAGRTNLLMKITRILLASLACLALLPADADAAAKRGVRRGGGGGHAAGGPIMLETPTPVSPLDHNNRGVELGSKGHWPDAIREHEIALSMQAGNKEFRTNLSAAQLRYGNILFAKGDTYGAMKQFRGSLFVDPDNLPADEGLDECYKKLGKNPFDVGYRRNVAIDMEVSGHYEDAIVEYRKLVKMEDSGKNHADLGYVFIKADKVLDGYQELRVAAQKNWGNTREERIGLSAVHLKLADILKENAYSARDRGAGTLAMRRLLNAAQEYKRAVTANKDSADAVQGLIECSREACALRPTFDNYLMLGGGYLLAGDFAHAKLAYDQCYKIDRTRTELGPARIAMHQEIARSALSSEELIAESISKVTKFIGDDQDNARWWYILGRLKQHQGDNAGAMEAYRRAEKLNRLIDPDLITQIKILGGEAPSLASAGTGGGNTPRSTGAVPATTAGGGNAAPAQPVAPPVNLKNMETYSQVEGLMSSDPDAALNIITEALNRTPDDGHLYLLKGNCQRKKDDLNGAAASLRQSLAFKDPDAESALRTVNTLRVQGNIERADQFSSQGNYVKAQDEIGDAIIKAPNLSILHLKQADILQKMGDTKGAEQERQKAASMEKTTTPPAKK